MLKIIVLFFTLNVIYTADKPKPDLTKSHEDEKTRIINLVKNAKVENNVNEGKFKILYDDGNSFEELFGLKSSLTISTVDSKKQLLLSMGFNNKCICTEKKNLLTDCNYIKDSRKIFIELNSQANLLISQFKDLCNSGSFYLYGYKVADFEGKQVSSVALINYKDPKKNINLVALNE